MKCLSILGSTGSIGSQTLDVVSAHPELLAVKALAAGSSNLESLAQQVRTFKPELVAVPDKHSAVILNQILSPMSGLPRIECGPEALGLVAAHPDSDVVVTAVVGLLGLLPTVEAIKQGKTIALANKETLVAAGCCLMPMAKRYGAPIIPMDSEHSAIFQCLQGAGEESIAGLILTGSGGPFRNWSKEEMRNATISDALRHPNWSMGPKITVDSATLMNKGLEFIEARWLFDMEPERIKVVIHPQSILHSAVQFIDGSIIGQFGAPDMRLPIQYALFYPHRVASSFVPEFDFAGARNLSFEEPDLARFHCLSIAQDVARNDSTAACALNAANELAVDAFLHERIKFTDIPTLIERVLESHKAIAKPSLQDIFDTDREVREHASEMLAAWTVLGSADVPSA